MSDLLPPNATGAERALSLAIERHAAMPAPLRDVWDADTCPEHLLAWLAWALTVDEWDGSWSEEQKRAVIKASINVHRIKGTIGAVSQALSALVYTARVQEWFNQIPFGEPYTFRALIEVRQSGVVQGAMQSLPRLIQQTKNLRSHLDAIALSVTTSCESSLAAVVGVGSEIVLSNYVGPPMAVTEQDIAA